MSQRHIHYNCIYGQEFKKISKIHNIKNKTALFYKVDLEAVIVVARIKNKESASKK